MTYSLPFSPDLVQVKLAILQDMHSEHFSIAKEFIPQVSSKVLLTLLSHIQLLETGTPFQTFENLFYRRMVPRQATPQLHSAQLKKKKIAPNLDFIY